MESVLPPEGDWKNHVKADCGESTNSTRLREILVSRKMKANEIVVEYFLKMKEIASRVYVEDEALIEYVIDRIPDKECNKAIMYDTKTLKEFKEKMKAYSKLYRKIKRDSGFTQQSWKS